MPAAEVSHIPHVFSRAANRHAYRSLFFPDSLFIGRALSPSKLSRAFSLSFTGRLYIANVTIYGLVGLDVTL